MSHLRIFLCVVAVVLLTICLEVEGFDTCAPFDCGNRPQCRDGCAGSCKCDFQRACKFDYTKPCLNSCFDNCPADITVNSANGWCSNIVSYDTPDVAPSCGEFVVRTQGPGSYGSFNVGTTTVAFDSSSSASTWSCSFKVTVLDKQKPSITCPKNRVVSTNSVCGGVQTDYRSDVKTWDNCGGQTWDVTAGKRWNENFPVGDTTVTLEVTDTSGNKNSCSFLVSVVDRTDPTIIGCPSDQVVDTDPDRCDAHLPLPSPTVTDNCPGATIAKIDGPSNEVYNQGETTVRYRATDKAGNTEECSFKVKVNDGEKPTVLCPPDIISQTDPDRCDAHITYPAPFGTDNCFKIDISTTPETTNDGIFPKGNTTQTYTAEDGDGNVSNCSFVIAIYDKQVPTVQCYRTVNLPDVDATCDEPLLPPYPLATDNCNNVVSNVQGSGIPFGTIVPLGTYDVTFNITDDSGNVAICPVSATVVDVTLPRISCPSSSTTFNDPGVCGASVFYTLPIFSDECNSDMGLFIGYPPNSVFPVDVTTVTYVATDSVNRNYCSFTVTVIDNEKPIISCPQSATLFVEPGTCVAYYRYEAITAVDNCAVSSVIQTAGKTSSQPYGIGSTLNSFVVTDINGVSDTCSFTVTVVDDENPVVNCPTSLTFPTGPSSCSALVTFPDPSVNDNCGTFALSHVSGPTSGSTLTVGVYPVTYTATDSKGNVNTCVFDVIVKDTSPPVVACPPSVSIYTTVNECINPFDVDDGVVTDNCPLGTVVIVKNLDKSDDKLPFGKYKVIQSATDSGGNTASCTQEVTFIDDIPPVLYCTDLSLTLDVGWNTSVMVSSVVKKVSDNCGFVPTLTLDQSTFTYRDFLASPVTVTATGLDLAGNAGKCSSDIAIKAIQNIIISPEPNSIKFIGRSFPIKWADVGVFNSKSKIDIWLTNSSGARVMTIVTGYQYYRLTYTTTILSLPPGVYHLHANVDGTGDGGALLINLE
eukprot:CAMPEP_0184334682 /NCGR_PEP_ID=MMETSP1089-20130417/3379_1 /TAXON_ID=38269 ORGANISM="Gloeochaete wittrockiana, Strain SAG46.84" /NCGR_SAMPLE_ID=MMETSP1089 /ASSEMBLY_ACC=CAM_ASM_000445 /LENGTH=977 /DNA_ID=CAMNT_0026659001 /DNA_START=96 /DNA_END=3029 /DNA_ORIENTATION=+